MADHPWLRHVALELDNPAADNPALKRVERPWGWFETLGAGETYLVKRLCIHAGQRISLQRHHHRSEHWVVVSGHGVLECDGIRHSAGPGTGLEVPCGAVHRATAAPEAHLLIVEVQRGTLLSEDDIERIADDYQRPSKTLGDKIKVPPL